MDKQTIIVDFDGVIHSYESGWQGANVIPDPPVPGAIHFLEEAITHFQVSIFSSRSHQEGGIQAMRSWLWRYLAPGQLEKIQFPLVKPPAILQIDDRAFCFEGTFPSVQFIKEFQPWNKKQV